MELCDENGQCTCFQLHYEAVTYDIPKTSIQKLAGQLHTDMLVLITLIANIANILAVRVLQRTASYWYDYSSADRPINSDNGSATCKYTLYHV